jgi:predicted HTH transcriptional regulator
MARKKYRYNSRYEPSTERSLQEYVFNAPQLQISRIDLLRLVRGGEDTYLELKVRLSNIEKIAQEICAMANTDGGTMVFGVDDQLRVVGIDSPDTVRDEIARICREEIVPPLLPLLDLVSFDNGKNVVALEIEPRKRPYRTRDGRFYLRFGAEKREATREELSVWLDEIRPLSYENLPVFGASESDIDDMLLWTFAREFSGDAFDENLIKANYATGEFLKRDLLLASGNMDEFRPTVAAILLFGANDRVPKLVQRSNVILTRFSGETANSPMIEKIEIGGNLLTSYERAVKFIERYCDLSSDKSRGNSVANENHAAPVKARSRYFRAAVLEAVSNAFVHRDLAIRDVATRVSIFDSSLEIANPRRTNGFVPPAKNAIRYGIPQRLNPQITAIFTSEAYGADTPHGGLPMLLRESRLFSGKKSEIITTNDEFKIKIFGR